MTKVLIVTGSGRSGTSSVGGTLKRLGFRIPQPEVATDENNPRGYYEPLWIAEFHKEWLNSLPVRTIDARPHAGEVAMASLTPERRAVLREWLAEDVKSHPDSDVVVIKETRAYWVYPMWRDVADDIGAELISLTMLRHPTQVVRSRDTAYLSAEDDALRLQRETANVGAWMNSVFVTERATRHNPRAFVPYYDLLGDWRGAMTRACGQLGLPLGDLTAPHPVDDFLTSSLNRSADVWDGLEVPAALRDLADQTWAASQALVTTPDDRAAMAELDRLSAAYGDLYRWSAALAGDEATYQVYEERRRLRARLAVKNERIEKLRTDLETRMTRKNARLAQLRAELRELRARDRS
ncbi:sulfotransferase family protein [Nocardioides sp. R-C-SC26]|uniref:sulfotransferase family protein n=1 Tax=Nocardioides sp. R-C-SC26 TaxID=2870414 RepID=UPI001E44BDB9|nr:hypothetical protein [Nocardioides sp. R-C-SC26]